MEDAVAVAWSQYFVRSTNKELSLYWSCQGYVKHSRTLVDSVDSMAYVALVAPTWP